MNLSGFLKEVDRISEKMTREELADFIHETARVLSENGRPAFLERLHGAHGENTACGKEPEEGAELSQRFAWVDDMLTRIEEEELCLAGSLNYEYDDWYDGEEEEFLYEDPDGVADVIVAAGDFVHACVDQEAWQDGYETARRLLALPVMATGEIADYTDEPMTVEELVSLRLCALDYRRLVLDGIYAAYCANEPARRAKAVYEMIESFGRNTITLEMVMQHGEELPEWDDFLESWTDCLGNIRSACAERLLTEALELADDPERLLATARKYVLRHPGLYRKYLLSNLHQTENGKLLAIGKEALDAIDTKYVIRSQIALLMSRLALEEGLREEAEQCWVEALRSDTSVVNLLRLVTACRDFEAVREQTESICRAMYEQEEQNLHGRSVAGEVTENRVSVDTAYMLAFLNGAFAYVRERGMQKKKVLGWSGSFMKCGLAVFLLLLLQEEQLGPGCKEMCRRAAAAVGFEAKKYDEGMDSVTKETDQDCFWSCLRQWKTRFLPSKEEKQDYMQWIEGLVEKRTAGIMEINRRNYYGECAAFIAAVGEVKASWGDGGEKQRVMLSYKQAYSRRRAFHEELRRFGMRDR